MKICQVTLIPDQSLDLKFVKMMHKHLKLQILDQIFQMNVAVLKSPAVNLNRLCEYSGD